MDPLSYLRLFQISILSLAAPLILIPTEKIFPFPFISEELIKTALVFFVIKMISKNFRFFAVFLVGFFFSLSENVLYLTNFITEGIESLFLLRILILTPLHIALAYLIYFFLKKKRYWGILIAILIHFVFNFLVTSLPL